MIKEYFSNYFLHSSDVTIDAAGQPHRPSTTPPPSPGASRWSTPAKRRMTGGRLKRVGALSRRRTSRFCFTYGDGVADIDIGASIAFHRSHGRKATLTAVMPPGRYGAVSLIGDRVERFVEKPPGDQGFVNGGFFVLDPSVVDVIAGDETPWEGGAAGDARRARRIDGLSAQRLLAADGHAARQEPARGAMGVRARAVEDVAVNAPLPAPKRSGAGAGCCSPATPASREAGRRCGWRGSARRPPASRSRPIPSPALFDLAERRARPRFAPRRSARARGGRAPPSPPPTRTSCCISPRSRSCAAPSPNRSRRSPINALGTRASARRAAQREAPPAHPDRHLRQGLRQSRARRGFCRGRPARRQGPLLRVQGGDGNHRARLCADLFRARAAWRWRPRAAATSSAAATTPRTASSPTSCAPGRIGRRPVLRMPEATRPWQHALDCLAGYLLYVERRSTARSRARSISAPTRPIRSPSPS